MATPTGGFATPTGGFATPTGGFATPTGGFAAPENAADAIADEIQCPYLTATAAGASTGEIICSREGLALKPS
ncbi:hypothetical protein NLX86_26070 [Streptomyces sp. A3M-1-3]|uniref:hypothetical protein n=1 Tax=Streptomyces sp. A3M-1-3 TaxID=2962044 RepID=UPI0020B8D4F7|nr:hypothetical protein [Streptomyces sp. A3M-1-3]MCP3821437.1 hypothetical protein [Streptomyces sp. A3M-1-3]